MVPLALGDLEMDELPVDVLLPLPLLPLLPDAVDDTVGRATEGVIREEGEERVLREACPEGVRNTEEVLVAVTSVLGVTEGKGVEEEEGLSL